VYFGALWLSRWTSSLIAAWLSLKRRYDSLLTNLIAQFVGSSTKSGQGQAKVGMEGFRPHFTSCSNFSEIIDSSYQVAFPVYESLNAREHPVNLNRIAVSYLCYYTFVLNVLVSRT
jgi:hypothetical protein